MRRALLLLAVLVLCAHASGCGCSVDQSHRVGRESAVDDGGSDAGVIPWGTFAAGLAVPACPDGELLLVTTADDELEGGTSLQDVTAAGTHLSLAEALWLSANRAGPQTIRFDEAVFPVEAPATIVLSGAHALPQDLGPVCIDARDRGVIVDWVQRVNALDTDAGFTWTIGAASLQVGLELHGMPHLRVEADGQVAGNRFFQLPSEPRGPTQNALVTQASGTVGPGNVMLVPNSCVELRGGLMLQNHLGVDPLTGARRPCVNGVMAFGNVVVDGNSIDSIFEALSYYGGGSTDRLTFARNLVGAHLSLEEGYGSGAPPSTSVRVFFGSAFIGPDNDITAAWLAIDVIHPTPPYEQVTITRNRLRAQEGIRYTFHQMEPPAITAAGPASAEGTCALPGTVEVFWGPSGRAENFLGEAACAGTWRLDATIPPGVTLVATVTDAATGFTSVLSTSFVVP